MKKYRPVSRRRVNPVRLGITIAIIVVVIALVIFGVYMFSKVTLDDQAEAELFRTGTFVEGVSVGGVDVSGLTYEQGKEAVIPVSEKILNAGTIDFTVKDVDTPYHYTLEELGVSVDTEQPLRDAMLYGREGTRWSLQFGNPEPKDFPVERQYDESVTQNKLTSLISSEQKSWDVEPEPASYVLNPKSDENSLTTGGEIVKQDSVDGRKVLTDSLIPTVVEQINSGNYASFELPTEVVRAEHNSDTIAPMELIGQYTTKFDSKSGSAPNRMYNIWKISDKLNGARIKAGNEFSVNDHVGDRTEKLGWKLAPGIENGEYTDQPGGGICQVSTTLYNAVLRAELKPTKRVPHTIPSSYVDKGLDATISTGGPDFAFENTTDSDVIIVVKCNVPAREVTVQLYGNNPRDYYLRFSGKVEETTPKTAAEFIRNGSLSDPWAIEEKLSAREGMKAFVYVTKYDKKTDKVISGPTKTDITGTYKPSGGKYEIGSKVPEPTSGMTVDELRALRDKAKAEEQNKLDAEKAAQEEEQRKAQEAAQPPVESATQPPEPQHPPAA